MRARTAAVRLGRPGDADTLAWVVAVARAEYIRPAGRPADWAPSPRPTAAAVAAWRDALAAAPPARVLVAEIAGEVVATAALEATHEPGTVRLAQITVLPHLWGRGVATLLHAHVVRQARADGAVHAITDVWDVHPRGRLFHEARGWRADGRRTATEHGSGWVGLRLDLRVASDTVPEDEAP